MTADANGWMPIEDAPKDGTAVLLYFARLSWPGMGDLRSHVERCEIGWFSGGEWYESGTGHEIFEDWREGEMLPTHWQPLPPAPKVAP